MNKHDDYLEWWKAIQRERAKQEIIRRQEIEAKRKLHEANKRLIDILQKKDWF